MSIFSLHIKFNAPANVSEELEGHSVMLLQSATLVDGTTRATVFLTVNGNKFVVCHLNSARSATAKIALRLSADDGEVVLSCSQGANVVISGMIEGDSCCAHEHDENCTHPETELTGDIEGSVSNGEDEEMSVDDDEEIDEDEEEEEEDEEEEEVSEDESEEEETVDVKATPTKDNKKVTFNKQEQGPHTPASPAAPLRPALKQPVAPAKTAEQSRVGVTASLPGGLKYTILKEGRGPAAVYGKRVNVKYVGCLASNGKRFDKGQIRFKLGAGEVIEGWDKGVKDMRVGESRRILIPAHLGYGKRGAPPAIPGNAALAFEVELLDLM